MFDMGSEARIKPEAILEASFAEFMRYGFRRTSMEDIARAAGVSRASLYSHFENKEMIFRSLAQSLHERAVEGVEAALRKPGTLEARVRGAIEAKVLRFLEIAYGSPHGAELIDESSRSCGDIAIATEKKVQALLTEAFRGAARKGEIDLRSAGLSAVTAAELVYLAAGGLKQGARDTGEFQSRLAKLLAVFFAGLAAP